MPRDIDLVDRILSRNLGWVSAADTKVAPILAVDTAMLGVLAALIPSAGNWRTVPAILAAISALFLGASVVALVIATFPRLAGPKASLVYFGGIIGYDRDKYVEKLLAATQDDLLTDMAQQCHRNAEIASTKLICARWAMIFLFCSLPFWLAAIGFLYAARVGNI